MKKLKYFSGIKPTVEDLEFDQLGKENAITDRQQEMFTDGVASGLLFKELTPGAYVIEPGLAYVNGERIQVPDNLAVSITPTQDDQFIFLKFETQLSHPVQHFVTGATFNIYQSDSYSVQIRGSETPEANELIIAKLNLTGTTDLREMIQLGVDDRLHEQNTDIGTNAPDFKVGIGDPLYPEGLSVVIQSSAPLPPIFPRIEAILPDGPLERMLSSNPELSRILGRQTSHAQVIFTWNFLNITGAVINTDEFRMDDAEGYQFAANELVNYYIRFYPGQEFRIISNTVTDAQGKTTIEVEGDLTGVSTVDHPAQIYPDVTEYRYSIIPIEVEPETPIITNPNLPPPAITVMPANLPETMQGSSTRQESPIKPYCAVRLPVGRYFMFSVQSVRYRSISDNVVMRAGSFDWQGSSIIYTCPFLVEFPQLEAANLTLTGLEDGRGFIAVIDGWEDAEFIEYAWRRTPEGGGGEIDFNDPDNHPAISHQRNIEVIIVGEYLNVLANPHYANLLVNLGLSREVTALLNPEALRLSFDLAARPLDGRQVVGDTITGTIVLAIDPDLGQTPILNALQSLAIYCDVLNMNLQNMNAIREAQVELIESQLAVIDSVLTAGQFYTRYSLQTNITIPFPELPNLPGIGGVGGYNQGANQRVYNLNHEQYEEQIFVHDIGHLMYMVIVRDIDGIQVDADIDLDPNQVTVKLAEPMEGTVLIIF